MSYSISPATARPERLGEAVRLAVMACELYASGDRNSARELVAEADETIEPLLLDSRPLAVASDRLTRTSRVDLSLGEIASGRANAAVEVRCWSARDWSRLIREANAWKVNDGDPALIDGRADLELGRIQLRLASCNILNDLPRRVGRDTVDAANAVETFAHEIEHFRDPEGSEAKEECAARRELPSLARTLGVERSIAEFLSDEYEARILPTLTSEYRDPNCDVE